MVNNAGILRDRIFHRMSVVDFDEVIKVHLNGAFYVSRAAANHFKEQKSGAFVHFTSTSGLIGNFGQANYAAAKLGIVGLSRGIALDMQRFNVRSNCISPFAWSRMIGTIPTETPEQKARVERIKTDDAGQDRAAGDVPALAISPRTSRARSSASRMHEIYPVQPAAAGALACTAPKAGRRRRSPSTRCRR